MSPDLLHIAGYLTGAALYAMLLVMAARDTTADRLTVGAGVLGLTWNSGELLGHVVRVFGWLRADPWIGATSFSALGLLAAVVIHSVSRGVRDGAVPRWLAGIAYAGAAAAALLQWTAAARGRPVPDSPGLLLLTATLVGLAPVLLLTTRRQPNGHRAAWMTALAVFAVSALHVTNFHGTQEGWSTELLGHHSSIPIAFAILYQDYRFALADLFLKQALMLVAVVAVVFGVWSLLGPAVSARPDSSTVIAVLLTVWVASILLAPLIQHGVTSFVDRIVLRRAPSHELVPGLVSSFSGAATESALLDIACRALEPALSATRVTWAVVERPGETSGGNAVVVVTAEAPSYVLRVGRLADGRRLLSDDLGMLDRVSVALGRQIDMVRLARERYEVMHREQEMQALATEAELKALRAQINPHFLFNALTTVGHLIQVAPDRALATLLKLTTLLRAVLRTDGEFTTVSREMDLVSCYLDIERARFEERLQVTLAVPDELSGLSIPTLLVQPLVENAVKHGIAGARRGGFVEVSAMSEGPVLHLRVRNSGLPLAARQPMQYGVGLSNVARRLASHYGTLGTLTIWSEPDGITVAEVALPLSGTMEGSTRSAPRLRA